MMRGTLALAALLAGAGCARAQTPPPAAATDTLADTLADSTPPVVTFGTLSQNDISVRLRDDQLELRFVPLDARVVTLLAEDGAAALTRLTERYRPQVDSAGREAGVTEPGLALVTFFGQQDGVRFDPQLVVLDVRGRLLRPMAIVPLSPQFSAAQLDARQSAMAIYLYEELLPVWDPFTLTYGPLASRIWESRLPLLERERTRLGRAR